MTSSKALEPLNSAYASSTITRQSESSSRSTSASGVGLPEGLFGDAMAMIFACCLLAAASTPSMSTAKALSRSTSTILALHTCAVNAYMPNVGTLFTTASPGASTARKSRSMISSLPLPTTTCSGPRPA